MASTIVNFPSGKKETMDIITSYKATNGMDIVVLNTNLKENENQVVGITYKPVGEENYTKVVNVEDWNNAKKILVDDINDKKEEFTYQNHENGINVTEDFMRNLALREENLTKLNANYQTYLSSLPPKEVEVAEVAPLPIENTVAMEGPTPTVEQPEVQGANLNETPIVEFTPIPEIEEAPASINEKPAFEVPTPVVEQPVVEPIMSAPTVEVSPFEQSPMVDAAAPVVEPAVIAPSISNEENKSIVTESYLTVANDLVSQMKVLSEKYLQTMEEMVKKMNANLEESQEYRKLSMQTYDNAQQILASQVQNNNIDNFSKVA